MAEDLHRAPSSRAYAQSSTSSLADVLERVLDKGIVIAGDVKLLLADVEVLTLQIRLVVCSVDKAREIGLDWWTDNPAFNPRARKEATALSAAGKREQDLEKRLGQLEEELGVKTPS